MLRTLLIVITFLLVESAKGQTPEKALENIHDNYTRENIYIHYDKENYVVGETVWFKAYVFAGVHPSLYSTSLAVELLNDSGRLMDRQILPVLSSAATGNFNLSKRLPQAHYIIRAYTRRMLNFGATQFYEKQLSIFNPETPVAPTSPSKEIIINFFPEGGTLVAGLSNVVAFKCTDKYGNPVKCDGYIKDSYGSNAATFKTLHNGMGKFSFIPAPNEIYTVICNAGKITQQSELLSKPSGITFQVSVQDGKTFFTLNKE